MSHGLRAGRAVALLVAAALALVGAVLVVPTPAADAAVVRAFTPYFSTQTNGEIAITGNALLTCDKVSRDCPGALAGTVDSGNNNFTMRLVDTDGDPATKSSSAATVRVPDGSTVLYAGLFWGATASTAAGTAAANSTIKLKAPGASTYSSVTASRGLDVQASNYSAYADITGLVQRAGGGPYTAADITSSVNSADQYAGWSVVVAYSNPALPLRDLTVFGGYAAVGKTDTISASISGFLTPAAGTVNARIGSVVYEGDQQLTGDYLTVNGTRVADAQSPSSNFFDSRVTTGGANLTDRTPANVNNMALDAKVVDAPNVLPNGARSADLVFGTNGDVYFPAALTTQVDLYAPNVRGTTSVVDLSSHDPAQVGDTLEYTVALSNTGQDPATGTVLDVPLPAGTTYVPGSLAVTDGPGAGAQTDVAGDDRAEVSASAVRFRLGTGASAREGGTLASNGTSTVRFRAVVQPAAAGTNLDVTSSVAYTAKTLAKAYTYRTNTVSTAVATLADLALTLTGPDAVSGGQDLTWRLGVSNAGPSTATGVVVTATLPEGATYDASGADPAGPTCVQAGRTLTCTLPDVPAGVGDTFVGRATTDPDSDATSLPGTATVTSSTSDPDPTNNTSSVTTAQRRAADVSLVASIDPTSARPGDVVTFLFQMANAGPSRARATTLAATLPPGFTVVGDVGSSRGTCDVSGADLSCALGTTDAGEPFKVSVSARLDPAWTGVDPLRSTASVQTTTFDPDTANNSANVLVAPAPPQADLQASQELLSGPVVAGQPVRYRLTVTNRGPSVATYVSLVDELDERLLDPAATSEVGGCAADDGLFSCAVGDLAPGASVSVLLSGTVAAGADGGFVNLVRVQSETEDPDRGNDSDRLKVPVATLADLSLTATADPVPARVGDELTFTLTTRNDGPSDARGVVLTEVIPDRFKFLGTAGGATCERAGQDVTCDLGTVPAGATVETRVTLAVPDVDGLGTVVNVARLRSDTDDPDSDDLEARTELGTQRSADVSVTTSGPSTLVAGTRGTWDLTIGNDGPSTAEDLELTDTLPEGLGDLQVDAPEDVRCTVDGARLRCDLDKLGPDSTRVVRFRALLDRAATATVLVDSPSVTASTPDPTASNDTASTSSAVTAVSDLTLGVTGPARVTAGDRSTWTLAVRAAGPSRASDSLVRVALPPEAVDVTVPSGCTLTQTSLVCDLGALDPDEDAAVEISATVRGDAPDQASLTLQALVSSSASDPEPGDNTASAATAVSGTADLDVTAGVDPASLVAGAAATYRVDVENHGPSTAAGVQLRQELPAGLEVEGVQGPGACTVAGQVVTCDLGTVPAGTTARVQVSVLVPESATGPVTSTAEVTSTTDDRVAANDQDSVTSDVRQVADLGVTAAAEPRTVVAGQATTYTLAAVNAGPSRAADVVLTDELPAGTEVLDAGGCVLDGRTLTCPVGPLERGEDATARVVVLFPANAPARTVRTEAAVTGSTPDPDASDDRSSVDVEVVQQAALRVDKTATPGALVPGNRATYHLLVGSAGPSTARDVRVTDAVPAPLDVVSATRSDGTACEVEGRDVSCALGDLGLVQDVVTVVATLPADYVGDDLVNTAEVASATDDPDRSDDRARVSTPVVPEADLGVVARQEPTEPVPGTQVRRTLTSTNRGPSVAQQVRIEELLPYALLQPATDPGPGGRCTIAPQPDDAELGPNAGVLLCTWDEVGVGESVSVVVTARVRPEALGTLASTASTGSPTPDPETADNRATVSGALRPSADLAVSKRVVGTATAGSDVSWEVVVDDLGPSSARTVVLVDDVPAPVSAVRAVAADGLPCEVVGQQVTCRRDRVDPGSPLTVTVSGTLAAGATGPLVNRASVSAATPDPEAGNDAGSAGAGVLAVADLGLTKTMTPAAPVPGEQVAFTLTSRNRGPSTATGVHVDDVLPGVLKDVTAVPSGDGRCVTTPRAGSAGELRCTWPQLAVGAAATVVVTASVAPEALGSLENTASTGSAATDPGPDDDEATVSGTLVPSAGASVTKRLVGPADPGGRVTWAIVVDDAGPSSARSVVVVDDVPATVSDLDATTADPTACTVVGQRLSCRWDRVDPGAPRTVTLTGRLDATATGELTNAASVSTATADPDHDDDTSVSVAEIGRRADLLASGVLSPAVPVPGQPVTLTLRSLNRGPSAARAVVVEDVLPVSLLGAVAAPGPGGDCDLLPRVGTGGVVSCTWADLAVGATAEVTVTGRVAVDALGTLSTVVTTRAQTPDPVVADNAADVASELVAATDVSLAKRLVGVAVAGQQVTWELVVDAAGPSSARAVELVDDVPDAVTGVRASTASGEPCTVTGQRVRCAWDRLDPGTTTTVTVVGTLDVDATGTLSNTASVSTATADATAADDTSVASAVVAAAPGTGAGDGGTSDPDPSDGTDGSDGPGLAATGAEVGLGLLVLTTGLLVGGAALLRAGRAGAAGVARPRPGRRWPRVRR
ncbi:DUF11 domain-containing protein [Microlunatus antarcticus]|uniref:Putative repeat protein (TIGR01451 family) n=1 Tax=Microlunatus antarcticus TaxID=53388 RepID=A0A7W5P8G3_9ACTN|nr:putative repeat protein (TIGR01451 family) [Microlunatus antarcticus]